VAASLLQSKNASDKNTTFLKKKLDAAYDSLKLGQIASCMQGTISQHKITCEYCRCSLCTCTFKMLLTVRSAATQLQAGRRLLLPG